MQKQLQNKELSYLKGILLPLGYQLDITQERPLFWKNIRHNDINSPYAFSLVLITLCDFTITIEGLNEPRLKRAIRAGLIEITNEEDVDALKELVFETDYDNRRKLEVVLPFFEQQLTAIATEQAHNNDDYKRALANISLLVEAAEQIE